MDKDQQGTNESLIKHTLLPKQRENTTEEEKIRLKSPPSSDVIIISDDEDEEATLKKSMLVSPRVNVDAFDELSIVVKGKLPKKKENNVNVASRADMYFSSTDLKEKKKEEEKKDVENVVESSSTSRKGYGHVSLDDLGVTVEDLKNIPWEAFDPTWEMRYDPWLCGNVEDLVSPKNDSDT